MEVLLVIALIGLVWVIWHAINNSEKKEKEELEAKKAAENTELKVSIPGAAVPKPKASESTAKKNPQKSSDALYAEAHNLWVCKHCETLNKSASHNCIACGTKKAS